MDNYIDNYVTHRDVLVHKIRKRFHMSVFILPLFLVLLIELFYISSNRALFPNAQNTYTVESELYISPLGSSSIGQVQAGIGGGPSASTSSARKTK